MNREMPIMVTGAGGMVGSTLVRHLAQQGFTRVIPVYRHECDLADRASTEQLFARTGATPVSAPAAPLRELDCVDPDGSKFRINGTECPPPSVLAK